MIVMDRYDWDVIEIIRKIMDLMGFNPAYIDCLRIEPWIGGLMVSPTAESFHPWEQKKEAQFREREFSCVFSNRRILGFQKIISSKWKMIISFKSLRFKSFSKLDLE